MTRVQPTRGKERTEILSHQGEGSASVIENGHIYDTLSNHTKSHTGPRIQSDEQIVLDLAGNYTFIVPGTLRVVISPKNVLPLPIPMRMLLRETNVFIAPSGPVSRNYPD
jgi:hypothetical protein